MSSGNGIQIQIQALVEMIDILSKLVITKV